MISCELHPFSPDNQEKLVAYLKRSEVKLLQQSAQAKVCRHQADMAADAVKSNPENKYEFSANQSLKSAQRYATFLEVLQEFKDQESPFEQAKLTIKTQ